jgi:hypothetical protein
MDATLTEQKQLIAQGDKALSQRDKLILATRQSAAAQIAGAMIISSGKPHSLEEAMQIYTDVLYTLFPQQGQDRYEEWARGRGIVPGVRYQKTLPAGDL